MLTGTPFAKTLWKIFSKILGVALWSVLIFDLAIAILILKQSGFDWNQFFGVITVLLLLFTAINFVVAFPPWVQIPYFFAYLSCYSAYGCQVLHSLPLGINYDASWSLPSAVNNLVGFSVGGNVIDLLYWSGFAYALLVVALQVQHWSLGFLAGRGVSFAVEIWQEQKETLIKEKMRYLAARVVSFSDANLPKQSIDGERKVFKPRFFGDRVWYVPAMFLLMMAPVFAIPLVSGLPLSALPSAGSGSLWTIFGLTFLVCFLIFLPIFLWEATTRIILEKDRLVIRTLFFFKKEALYGDIREVRVIHGGVTQILYGEARGGEDVRREIKLFPWPLTAGKVLRELKLRLRQINIDEDMALESIKIGRGLGNVVAAMIAVLIFLCIVVAAISKARSQTQPPEKETATNAVVALVAGGQLLN